MTADGSTGGQGTGGSFSAQHAVAPRRSLNVAPTDGSTKFNTIRIPLIPVACWRLNDPAFAFDSSFVAPGFRDELAGLAGIVGANPECPAAIFGHCDPAGSDALNKTLGDRRAIAVYALLTRQPDLWAYLYDHPQVGDAWDLHMVQTMLGSVLDAEGHAYYDRDAYGITGRQDAPTTDAVKRFQADAGLTADGAPGKDTRKALFGAYMDRLCDSSDPVPGADGANDDPGATDAPPANTPPPQIFRMKPEDFLGGAGSQPGDLPKMSLQSCGKLNPIVLLTSSEMGGADATRNADDAPNRRIVMFFFPKGTKVDAGAWPCPEVKETNGPCKSQFWPDGDSRRQNGGTKRLYEVTRDTMACRFYDRFARRSPCEGGVAMELRLWLHDRERQRMPNAPYRLTTQLQTRTGTADGDGLLVESRIPEEGTCTLEWGEVKGASSSDQVYRFRRQLDVQTAPSDKQARDLYNLAYGTSSTQAVVSTFDDDYPGKVVDEVHTDGIPKKSRG